MKTKSLNTKELGSITAISVPTTTAAIASATPSRRSEAEADVAKPDNRLPIDSETRKKNRTLPTEKVLHLLQTNSPDLFRLAEVVGKWVWVQFQECPCGTHRQTLAQLGFHWNRERQAWQHPCGQFRLHGAGDPRAKYQSYHPADLKAA